MAIEIEKIRFKDIFEYCKANKSRYHRSLAADVHANFLMGPFRYLALIALFFSSTSFWYRSDKDIRFYIAHIPTALIMLGYPAIFRYWPRIKRFSLLVVDIFWIVLCLEIIVFGLLLREYPSLIKPSYIFTNILLTLSFSFAPDIAFKMVRDCLVLALNYVFYLAIGTEFDTSVLHVAVLTTCAAMATSWTLLSVFKMKFYIQELLSNSNIHAYQQMSKILYRHQIRMIEDGAMLETTMPCTSGTACVISFDIIGSSKIKHIKAKEFFRNVFGRCNDLMNEGYDGEKLRSRAYRVKEMGDGFLASVGHPFESLSDNPAIEAINLAKRFAQIVEEESQFLHLPEPVCCGIGIAMDSISGFFPATGVKDYDVYGPGLVLATRYEGMRKILFEAEKNRSVTIIQEVVYLSLDPEHRTGFELLNLKDKGIVVRDDPSAANLYYKFMDDGGVANDRIPSKNLRSIR